MELSKDAFFDLLENKGKEFNFFFDMDGVIVDFYNDVRNLPKKYIDAFDNDRYEFWRSIEEDYGSSFWENLNVKLDGYALFTLLALSLLDIKILSAYPSFGISDPQCCIDGKEKWLNKHFNDKYDAIFCKSKDKCLHATNNSILIDDSELNIKSWEERGGLGILYTNYEDVVNKLIHILKN